MEEIRGEVKGKPYRGIVYSALNDRGEKVGTPFKSSLFGKSVGIEALEKHIEKSAQVIKNRHLRERSKQIISKTMRTCQNRTDFEKTLEKKGISAIFRTNDEGRIYGATFIDHQQKCVFNGSRLGKEFSANVFNTQFRDTATCPVSPISLQPPETQPCNTFDNQFSNKENNDTGIGGLFDIFSPAGSPADDYEEKSFLRRTKKKRRPKRHV